jgi:diguanylate cyclase (GGDEF)-like protein/PAS domain S-box-containing protein
MSDSANDEGQRRSGTEILQSIIDYLPSGVTLFGPDLEMRACNARLRELLEFPDELFREGLPSLRTLLHFNACRGEYGPGDPEELTEKAVERARAMQPHVFERVRPNGRVLEIRGTPLPKGGFVSIYTDITERRRAEETVRHVRDQLAEAIEFSPTFVWETDAAGRFTFLQGEEKLLGYKPENLLGLEREPFLQSEDEGSQLAEVRTAMAAGQPYRGLTLPFVRHDGGVAWLASSAQPLFGSGGQLLGYRGVDVDVTELTAIRKKLEQLALHDSLTGLANRHKFLERFELELARRGRTRKGLALLMVDVDHFKRVNDTWGHLAGDTSLKAIAQLLSEGVRRVDLVARFGGEEFVVLLTDIEPASVRMVAEKLRRRIEATPIVALASEAPLRLSVSIGAVALGANEDGNLTVLIDRADQAVYAAKTGGRNCVCLYPEDLRAHPEGA